MGFHAVQVSCNEGFQLSGRCLEKQSSVWEGDGGKFEGGDVGAQKSTENLPGLRQ